MIPSEVYALGASGNPIREIADYAMRRAEEVGAENVYDFSIGSYYDDGEIPTGRRPQRRRKRRNGL